MCCCVCVFLQGEIFIPLQLKVSAAFACFFGFTGQAVSSHLHKGAEPGVTAGQLRGLGLRWNHWIWRQKKKVKIDILTTHLKISMTLFFEERKMIKLQLYESKINQRACVLFFFFVRKYKMIFEMCHFLKSFLFYICNNYNIPLPVNITRDDSFSVKSHYPFSFHQHLYEMTLFTDFASFSPAPDHCAALLDIRCVGCGFKQTNKHKHCPLVEDKDYLQSLLHSSWNQPITP